MFNEKKSNKMKTSRTFLVLIGLIMAIGLVGCSSSEDTDTNAETEILLDSEETQTEDAYEVSTVVVDADDSDDAYEVSTVVVDADDSDDAYEVSAVVVDADDSEDAQAEDAYEVSTVVIDADDVDVVSEG